MDIYHKPLKSDEYTLLYLKKFINENITMQKNHQYKKISENKENFKLSL